MKTFLYGVMAACGTLNMFGGLFIGGTGLSIENYGMFIAGMFLFWLGAAALYLGTTEMSRCE